MLYHLLYPLRDLRYIMPMEMPVRLCALLFLQRLFPSGGGRGIGFGFLTAALALLVLDLQSFQRLARADLLEPLNLMLLRVDGFLPFIQG